jgi:hypothetical protein
MLRVLACFMLARVRTIECTIEIVVYYDLYGTPSSPVRERGKEREKEGERERGRARELVFIFKRNDGCLGTI